MTSAKLDQPRSTPHFPINRTVPFLAENAEGDNVILLDRFEFPIREARNNTRVFGKIAKSVVLNELGDSISPHEMEILLTEQFAAASEFVYGHPLWEMIRRGSKAAVYAYLLETRHYLAAASSRMAPSIANGIGLPPLTLLLSQHLLEEWDHQKFFMEALEVIGCNPMLTSAVRPLPSTLEWIHATRAIGYKSGLSAALCSGFMEYSSKETKAVRSWHAMLVDSGLLPASANKSIIGHLETDLEFDHADNWKRAIHVHGQLTPAVAAELLNDVATIAEMIYRWLSALKQGYASSIVYAMQIMTEDHLLLDVAQKHEPYSVAIFDGIPVWPSSLLDMMNWGDDAPSKASHIIAAATYAFGHQFQNDQASSHPFISAISRHSNRLGAGFSDVSGQPEGLAAITSSWLRSIDGHVLWERMIRPGADELVVGYILENYHYLASATRHIGGAIGSCTNPTIRKQLTEHLQDELEHCDILKEKLVETGVIDVPDRMRPLPTTIAFVGFLETLARQDWKAYIVVSAFLQASLAECRISKRHSMFYEAVIFQNPKAGNLIRTIWHHDDIDEGLGHDAKPIERLATLVANEPISIESLAHAAMAPALSWSFFDGIFRHYNNGPGSVAQRVGWQA